MRIRLASVSLAAALLAPAAAMAHPGLGGAPDFAHGFLHPFSGADHLIAMVAVGLYAARSGARALWLLPLAFLLTMATGATAAYSGLPLPLVEQGIGLSVVLMGLAVMIGYRLPAPLAIGLVGLFAFFHGHAHGAEGAGSQAFLPYAFGFLLATALLHLIGVALGLSLDRLGQANALWARRIIGAGGAVAGAIILAG